MRRGCINFYREIKVPYRKNKFNELVIYSDNTCAFNGKYYNRDIAKKFMSFYGIANVRNKINDEGHTFIILKDFIKITVFRSTVKSATKSLKKFIPKKINGKTKHRLVINDKLFGLDIRNYEHIAKTKDFIDYGKPILRK